MNFYDFVVSDISGQEVKLERFRNLVCLVVNTASKCGFTGQYAELEALYQKFRDRGFVVLAFPSNDFLNQDPGSNTEIKQFCELTYKVTFPIFSKGHVRGENKQPVYRFLTEMSPKEFRGDPGWNFVKFLIDRQGEVAARFSSMTSPLSKKISKLLYGVLG